MANPHILIVEDEWVIYDQLASFLVGKNYSVSPYTKNYTDAIGQIKTKLPDLVLLDINLHGDRDGIELAQEISKKYQIPFIYLSAFTDELTLKRAHRTNPETFLIKTKPNINLDQLDVSIRMVLNKKQPGEELNKEGILVFNYYYREISDQEAEKTKKTLFRFDDVSWVETDSEKKNYVVFYAGDKKGYYKSSLAKIKTILPFNFVRINSYQIVNLHKMAGKINHSYFSIGDEQFKIGKSYSGEVHRILHRLYVE